MPYSSKKSYRGLASSKGKATVKKKGKNSSYKKGKSKKRMSY